MNNVYSYLVDWSIRFLENKDMVKEGIVKIEKKKNGFVINYKYRTKYFTIAPVLEDSIFNILKNDGYFGIFTLNNMENLRFVLGNWKKLTNFKFLFRKSFF